MGNQLSRERGILEPVEPPETFDSVIKVRSSDWGGGAVTAKAAGDCAINTEAMKRALIILAIALAILAVIAVVIIYPKTRYFREFELDEKSFDAEAMQFIEETSVIDLPDGARGVRFHYLPPIDPIYFAEIEIPAESRQSIREQIEKLEEAEHFPKDFADDRCDWWPPTLDSGVIVSRRTTPGGYYLEAHLKEEGERLILYLKYFTI